MKPLKSSILLCLLAVVAGCARDQPPPFELTLKLKDEKIRARQSPFVRIELTNISSSTQAVLSDAFQDPAGLHRRGGQGRGLYLEVIGPSGKRLYPTWHHPAYYCREPARTAVAEPEIPRAGILRPGEPIRTRYWAIVNDCPSLSPPSEDFQEFVEMVFFMNIHQPGVYRLRAVYDSSTPIADWLGWLPFMPWSGRVQSPEIKLSVRD